ncbi:MAG: C4-type zinc ribbon domain-containing protein [Candidatus Omnitrophota bacterium]
MSEVSIKDQLKKLKELQDIDSQIYEHRVELREKPLAVEELRKQFETKKAHLQECEGKLKTLQVNHKTQEGELQSKESDIAKANSQLPQLKTNKEYQAKTSEIEHLKADKSIIEEKILLSFDEIDAINADIAKEKEILVQEEKKYLAQKKEVDDSVRELQDKVKVLDNKRNQITPEVDKTILSRYERILANKDGLALVPVKNEACGGCYMNVTPQVTNEIKMHEHFIYCGMCARILFIEEDL